MFKTENINFIPEKLGNKEISIKEAVNALAEFVCRNYPVFGLNKFSEDFRADILVKILEKGFIIFELYKKEKGDFFSFVYAFISKMIRSEIKAVSRKSINEKIYQRNCVENYAEKQQANQNISYKEIEAPKIPYNFKPVDPKNLRAAFHSLKSKDAKANIIMTLKAAYYVNDDIIGNLCSEYKIDKIDFTENLQECKNTLLPKSDRNEIKIKSRNGSYFYHRRYQYQMDNLENKYVEESDESLLQLLSKKEKSQKRRLDSQNIKLKDPKMYLRTSNKKIGEILDLCERQVGYYLLKALKENSEDKTEEDIQEEK